MRPDFVFSDSSVSPSFFFTTPAKKPRTECGCHPVTFEIAAMVVPPLAWSRPRTRSCLVVRPPKRDARCVFFFVFDLSCFASLVRGLRLVLYLAIRDLRSRRRHRRTTSTPLRFSYPRGPVLRRRYGASGLTSNAPFAAEVQSDIEQSCCSNPFTPAGRNRCEGLTCVGEDSGCACCRLIAPDGEVDVERIELDAAAHPPGILGS